MPAITQIPNNVYKSSEFFEIRRDLIDWLSNQDEFKDYDFAGSRMSILIDLLAYNTLYIQHFTNTATYESFIRTAKLRSSIIQHAQDMGYLPDSLSASGTEIAVQVRHPSNPVSISIPKGTKFVGVVDKTYPYDFVTWEDVTLLRDDKDNSFKTRLDIVQGRIIRQSFEYNKNTRVLIHNKNIDRNYIRVYINNDEWKDWTNNSMVHVSGLSNVFYQRETLEGYTEIYFGEGESSVKESGDAIIANYIGGLKPQIGSVITVEYLSTAGEEGNGSRQIKYVDALKDLDFVQIIENPDGDPNYTGTSGGGNREDVERIRELAPVLRESQRRCVTASDYESFLSYRFGSIIQAVQAFTDPNKPGYAFIAIKPKDGLNLTTVQKEDMQNFLSSYNVSTVTPVVMDPKYMYIKHDFKVQYQLNTLKETEEWLKGKVVDAIDRYYIEHVEMFNKSFHASKLLSYVDAADKSILGSTVEIKLVREEDNFYKTPMAGIKFLNIVKQSSVISSHFTFKGKHDEYKVRYASSRINHQDRQTGNIIVGPFKANEVSIPEYRGNDFVRDPNETPDRNKYYQVGTINYITDKIDFDLGVLNIDSTKFGGAYIEIEAQPVDKNIFAKDGSLIVFENDLRPQYTNITLEPITI